MKLPEGVESSTTTVIVVRLPCCCPRCVERAAAYVAQHEQLARDDRKLTQRIRENERRRRAAVH